MRIKFTKDLLERIGKLNNFIVCYRNLDKYENTVKNQMSILVMLTSNKSDF